MCDWLIFSHKLLVEAENVYNTDEVYSGMFRSANSYRPADSKGPKRFVVMPNERSTYFANEFPFCVENNTDWGIPQYGHQCLAWISIHDENRS
jgi:hypothetical protein